jgi:hypothetical protein
MYWNQLIIMKEAKYIGGILEIARNGQRYQATIANITKMKNTIRFKVLGMITITEDKQRQICYNRPVFISKNLQPVQLKLGVVSINNPILSIQYFLYPKNFQKPDD